MTASRSVTRTYEIVEGGRDGDRASKAFDYFILMTIAVSIAAFVLETEQRFSAFGGAFSLIEVAAVLIFTVEWLLRVWSCVADPSGKYAHPVWGRARYAVSPMSVVDLLAIVPFYIDVFIGTPGLDLRVLRAVRFTARIARLSRRSASLSLLGRVLRSTAQELGTVVTVIALLLLIASSLMYFAEHNAEPEKFRSIPASMWWAVITLTTIGYGDVTPVTLVGRALTSLLAILGIGLFALPAGILGSGFVNEARRSRQAAAGLCPHCGQPLPHHADDD